MSLTDIVNQLLQPSINCGLLERDFWQMTKAEVERYIEGYVWRMKERAQFDYTMADLIGFSVGRIMNSDQELPPIYEVYPSLFSEEIKEVQEEEKTTMKSINNFMAFAMAHNRSMKGVESKE